MSSPDNQEHIDLSDDYFQFNFTIDESYKSKNDKILNRIHGSFFVPEGYSRNKRYYSRSLWENKIYSEGVQRSLKDGMLGTLLHPTDEKMAHPIYSSHVVKKLWIDNDSNGMGEAYIFDTPVGRIVNTLGESKLVNLYVSSRAYGKITNEKIGGYSKVDENNFILKTFDIVLEPGFFEASPKFEASNPELLADLTESFVDDLSEVRKYHGWSRRHASDRARRLDKDLNLLLK